MVKKVFLSYTESDQESVALIRAALCEADFEVFFAPVNLVAGEYLSRIYEHIETADFFVVAISQAAVNSRWVMHELNTAIALRNRGKGIRVVPLFLEAGCCPVALADVRGIPFAGRAFDASVAELIDVLMGKLERSQSRLAFFEQFIQGLIVVEDQVAESIEILWLHRYKGGIVHDNDERRVFGSDIDNAFNRISQETAARASVEIREALSNANVSDEAISAVIDRFDHGSEFSPLLGLKQKLRVEKWIRRYGSEILIDLAADLWEGMIKFHWRGVTRDWFIKRKGLCSEPTFEEQADADLVISQAQKAGLLVSSSEILRKGTYGWRDAQINPSYDCGEMVLVIGKLAFAHRSQQPGGTELVSCQSNSVV
jgi:hypothetical protein